MTSGIASPGSRSATLSHPSRGSGVREAAGEPGGGRRPHSAVPGITAAAAGTQTAGPVSTASGRFGYGLDAAAASGANDAWATGEQEVDTEDNMPALTPCQMRYGCQKG